MRNPVDSRCAVREADDWNLGSLSWPSSRRQEGETVMSTRVRYCPLICGAICLSAAGWVVPAASGQSILIDDFNDGDDLGWSTHFDTTVAPWGPVTFDARTGVYHWTSAGVIPM